MATTALRAAPPSPLDPFLRPFLDQVGRCDDGYAPGAGKHTVATALDCPPAFAEALLTSARSRGLVEPARSRSSRLGTRWQVSRKGAAWLEDAVLLDAAYADRGGE